MIFASANFGLSYIMEVVALVIIGWLIAKYIWPYLKAAMNKKAESIRSQLSAGEEAKVASAALVEDKKKALDSARVEAKELVEQTRRSAGQLVAEGEQRAEAEYERLVARASVEIDLELARVRDEVKLEFADLILEVAHRIVDVELDEALHHHLIDSAIAATEAQLSATTEQGASSRA